MNSCWFRHFLVVFFACSAFGATALISTDALAQCATADDCDDDNPCTLDLCLTFQPGGLCQNLPDPLEGQPCDDGDMCTEDGRCVAGECMAGPAVECDDGDDCTTDACDPATGCTADPVADGDPCDDANACTSGDACMAGACTGAPVVCDDMDPCTEDKCDDATGECGSTPAADMTPCDNDDACLDSLCMAGVCTDTTPTDCDDDNACTEDACDPATGCTNDPVADATACDDGDACTETDVCTAGACAGEALDCDDGNPCTADFCAGGSCLHLPVGPDGPCDDGDPCTEGDTCDAAGMCNPGKAVDCDDANACTDDMCDPVDGCVNTNNTADCDDDDLCTDDDVCADGVCAGTAKVCDDDDACNGVEVCEMGQCVPGVALDCDDGDVCTDDSCDPTDGCVNAPNTGNPCDDMTACTDTSRCQAGVCTGVPKDCDDSDACTEDACDPVTGECVDPPPAVDCDDSVDCTVDACDPATGCTNTPDAAPCDDGNPCTEDVCDPVDGCINTPVPDATACDDGDLCTEMDMCAAGECVAGEPLDCDDMNGCTTDECVPADGCVNTPAALTPCDVDPCQQEFCDLAGTCRALLPEDCDDGIECTVDSCDPVDGCVNAPDDAMCDDTDPCTANVCDPAAGCDFTQPGPDGDPCDDTDTCTENDVCASGTCTGEAVVCDMPPADMCDGDDLITYSGGMCVDGACEYTETPTTCPAGCDAGACIVPDCDGTNDGAACDDGDPCTVDDVCTGLNACAGTELDCTVLDDGCNVGVCDPAASACVAQPNADGTTCDDSDACTSGDVCTAGECAGEAVDCDDDNACTDDLCDPGAGCVNEPNTAPCDDGDGDICTQGTCEAGACVAGAMTDCDDGIACTKDACDPIAGCMHTGSDDACDDANDCTIDTCDLVAGCQNSAADADGEMCDDTNLCTENDVCTAGACTGEAIVCDEPPADTCVGTDLVTYTGGMCVDGACEYEETATPCPDGCVDDACVVPDCDGVNNGDPCDDGDPCTADDVCTGLNTCAGTALDCTAFDTACTVGACDPDAGECVAQPVVDGAACDDGDACTAGDACLGGTCTPGAPADCDDGEVCTDDACDPMAGCTNEPNAEPCDDGDGDVCTVGLCEAGACVPGGPNDCDDGVECTVDSCDPVAGCVNEADASLCDDDDICTVDVCDPANGGCMNPFEFGSINTNGQTCDDTDDCTSTDVCTDGVCGGEPLVCDMPPEPVCDGTSLVVSSGGMCEAGECTYDEIVTECENGCDAGACVVPECDGAAAGTPCDDGVPCTENDACDGAGGCVGTLVDCTGLDDVCVIGECNVATGQCEPLPAADGTVCDDGDACTEGDACAAGQCNPGAPTDCDDANVCTDDACDPAAGCTNEPNTEPCDDGDGDACTTGMCEAGACAAGGVTDCDDGIECTVDSCDPVDGCVNAPDATTCDDGNACTINVCDPAAGGCANPYEFGALTTQGNACNDAEACTDSDVCTDGVCTGEPIVCDAPPEAMCDGADLTTYSGGACVAGACEYDEEVTNCPDGCEDAACLDPTCTGANNGDPCDDGDPCTADDVCTGASTCAGTVLDCSTLTDACNMGVCDPAAGECVASPVVDGATCDDGDACTDGDVCTAGECAPVGALDCDDDNPCTDDSCDPVDGCVNAFNTAQCDDGDGDACTSGQCAAGMCIPGVPTDCDDGIECTVDSCDPVDGCISQADASLCDDGNTCTVNVCDPAAGGCANPFEFGALTTQGNSCIDGDDCTSMDICTDGECAGEPVVCDTPPAPFCNGDTLVLSTGGMCEAGLCTYEEEEVPCDGGCDAGACQTSECDGAAQGTACDDGIPCTEEDVCDGAGGCAGTAVDCSALDSACSIGECNAASGACEATPAVNGTPCDDGDLCTEGEICVGGSCSPGAPLVCDDGDVCTDDVCDPAAGCTFTPNTAPCDDGDGDACTTGICDAGQCAPGAVTDCDDMIACTVDSCDPVAGCINQADASLCDDGNTCTVNVCDPANGGCANPFEFGALTTQGNACNDTDACTTTDTCVDGMCQGDAVVCDAPPEPVCNGDDLTISSGGTCADDGTCTYDEEIIACPAGCADGACVDAVCTGDNAGTACDDGNPCTETDVCDDTGACVGTALDCTGLDSACSLGVCDAAAGACVAQNAPDGASCDDGDLCTSGDACVAGECAPTGATNCDDGNVCTDDVCLPATGCSNTPNTNPCDDGDGDACTTGMCGLGQCVPGSTTDCDDGVECTNDSCDPVAGCQNAPDASLCDDGNTCTVNVCDPANGGCANPFSFGALNTNGSGCIDGDDCTVGDVCDAGMCSGEPIQCDDPPAPVCNGSDLIISSGGQCTDGGCTFDQDVITCPNGCLDGACTDTACDGATAGTTCDDGNPCTTEDACDGAGGCAGTVLDCSGFDDACTTGACHPGTGMCVGVPKPLGTSCEDGDLCTNGDFCSVGQCVPGALADCNDDNSCTDDACDATTGECANVANAAPCDTGSVCEAGICDGGACTSAGPLDCDDGFDCTVDSCDDALGCRHTPDGSLCNDGNACTTDICTTQSGCANQPIGDGVECSDGNDCTVNDVCVGGLCAGAELECLEPPAPSCDGDNLVVFSGGGQCDFYGGGCVYDSVMVPCAAGCADGACIDETCVGADPGTACDDGNPCTVEDACSDTGVCAGAAKDCSDSDGPCGKGICDLNTGECGVLPEPDGSACDAGDICSPGGICAAGQCQASGIPCGTPPPAECVGGNVHLFVGVGDCGADGCTYEPTEITCTEGCLNGQCVVSNCLDNPGAACDDGNPCTESDVCGADGSCAGVAKTCVTGNACVQGICDPATGECQEDGLPNSAACDDNNPCTTDTCHPFFGCVNLGNADPCNDGNACTSGDSCSGGECVGASVRCDEPPAPTCGGVGGSTLFIYYSAGQCDALGGGCNYELVAVPCPFGCGDGRCFDNVCEAGAAEGTACSDRNPCTVDDVCDNAGGCIGVAKDCSDLTTNCSLGACNAETGACFAQNLVEGSRCSDGDACTSGDRCVEGVCTARGPTQCNDLSACTTDSCDSDAGGCQFEQAVVCDDGNTCTGDFCSALFGCLAIPNSGDVCDDNSLCTTEDVCVDGDCSGSIVVCEAPPAAYCVDGNTRREFPAAGGACLPERGCLYSFVDESCEFGCLDGACLANACEAGCDDGDPCTVDTCEDGTCASMPLCNEGFECDNGQCRAPLCTGCTGVGDCGADSWCVYLKGASSGICTSECDDDTACPDDYVCERLAGIDNDSVRGCVPAAGACDCEPDFADGCDGDDRVRINSCGTSESTIETCANGCASGACCPDGQTAVSGVCIDDDQVPGGGGGIVDINTDAVVYSGGCEAGGGQRDGMLWVLLALVGVVAFARRRRTVARAAATVLIGGAFVVAATSSQAQAQSSTTSFALEHFEPLPSLGHNILNVGTSVMPGHLSPSIGFVVHYVDDPLTVRLLSNEDFTVQKLVDDALRADFAASIGLFDMLSIGVVLPMTLSQSGDDLQLAGRAGESVSGFALGDLRVELKGALLTPGDNDGLGLHISLPLYIPIGDKESFHTDEGFRLKPTLGLDYHHDSGFAVAVNAGFQIRPTQPSHNFISDDAIQWGLGFEVPTFADELTLMASLFGSIQTADHRDPTDLTLAETARLDDPIEFLAGLRWRVTPEWQAMAGAGAGITHAVGAPSFRGFLSFGYAPVDADSDEDGIMDSLDQCPDQPEDKDGFEDGNGCPDVDNDNDGILDVDDGAADGSMFGNCRDNPEDKDGFEDTDGCPDDDNDNDGVKDSKDKCPIDPEDADGYGDADGCPDPDNDSDGILDVVDGPVGASGFGACMNDPEDMDGWEDDDGCIDADNDGDGVLDTKDKCPIQPETKNGVDDEDGCPDTTQKDVKIEDGKVVILKKVFFAFNKDVIKRKSYAILNSVAMVLQENEYITKVRVEGHTDSDGKEAYNLDLSTRRANSVKEYLISKGVEAGRLSSQGFGEGKPLESNASAAGRAANRRVEFSILEVFGKPANVKVKSEDNRPETTE